MTLFKKNYNMISKEEFAIEKGVLLEYTGPGGDVIIPEGVREIGSRAFYGRKDLTGVTIPGSLIEIDNRAFKRCESLTQWNISPKNPIFRSQGRMLLKDNTLLAYPSACGEIVIPEGITEIGNSAFAGCERLTSVTIPEGVTEIGWEAFIHCTGLISVTIPESVASISAGAFRGCESLTSVTIPAGVTSISAEAFLGCVSLTQWNISPKNPIFRSQGGMLLANNILLTYPSARGEVVIPEGIAKIDIRAFYHCESLTGVTIPESVREIDDEAFCGCKSLTSITIPEGVREIDRLAFASCESLTSVTIPASVIKIGGGAFSSCTSLTSVVIPEGVTEIGDLAFYRCKSLTGMIIPENVKEIGMMSFHDCTSLTSVALLGTTDVLCKHYFSGAIRFALIAPRVPIFSFAAQNQPSACCGFAKLYLVDAALDEEIRAGYLKFIKDQRRQLVPIAVRHEELLRVMLEEKMLAREDIDLLLKECDAQNNIAAKAAVLEYAGRNLKPVDPAKEWQL